MEKDRFARGRAGVLSPKQAVGQKKKETEDEVELSGDSPNRKEVDLLERREREAWRENELEAEEE
ncbi:hypothetical protein NQZ68_002641 [Dissostichus eleginoides]|nr:hypothetical protein NQZ68_002641 [Dissostichus eleginoides]